MLLQLFTCKETHTVRSAKSTCQAKVKPGDRLPCCVHSHTEVAKGWGLQRGGLSDRV